MGNQYIMQSVAIRIRNEKGNIATDLVETKRIMREYDSCVLIN